MKAGEQINVEHFKTNGRPLNHKEIMQFLQAHGAKYWSWGAHAFTSVYDTCLRFKVNGHHHKGHVYIFLDYSDTFTIYLTTTQGKIQQVFEEIYIDGLFELLDEKIEKISDYKF